MIQAWTKCSGSVLGTRYSRSRASPIRLQALDRIASSGRIDVNHKRIYRLYRERGLTVRRKRRNRASQAP